MYSTVGFLLIFVGLVQGRIEFDLYEHKPSEEHVKRLFKRDLGKDTPHNDSIVIYKFLNGEYYGEIKVGSPAKSFKVIFDTTWADSWLPSSHCGWNEIVCKLHTQYDSSASSSYIPNNQFINETNSLFSLWGFLSTDTFHLPHVKLPNQTFLEATHISFKPFWQYRADGFIGLAFKDHSRWPGVTPFFYNLLQQGVVSESVFTFYMNRDETTTKAGKIILGGTQRTHVKNGTLTALHVAEKGYWKIQIDSIFAKQNNTDYPITQKTTAFFDSSANSITGPADAIMKLNYMLNAVYIPYLNRYSVNCRKYAKLPEVHFILNGTDFSIQSKYYVQRMTLDNIEACFSPFVPNPDPAASWELGGAFMMEFYTEFNLDDNMVRIGQTIF